MVRAGAALLLAMALPVAADPLLRLGQPMLLNLEGGRAVRLEIVSPEGSYIAGRIEAGDVRVRADLLTAEGRHFRRLADQERGAIPFQTMTKGPRMLIEVAATASGNVELALERTLTPDRQSARPRDYESPRIAALAAQLDDGTDAFWAEVAKTGTPLVEPAGQGKSVVTFLWRGARRNVRLFGGPSNDHEWLERLGDSDVWYKSFTVPDSTRLSYRLAPDVPELPGDARTRRAAILATAQADPLNLNPWPADAPDRFNQQSTLTLDAAPSQPGTPPLPDAAPVLSRFIFDSPRLGNSREITLSHAREFDPADPDLVLAIIFDGERAETEMMVPQMIETLMRQGRLPPILTVLIPSIDGQTRARELPQNADFADALADELLPQIAKLTGIRPDPARTVLAGASFGGLGAAAIAMRRPEHFGNVLSMSGSYWWAPKDARMDGIPFVAARFAELRRLPIRFFLSAGSFETSRGDGDGILQTSRSLRDILRLRGYDVNWREYAGGHDYFVWRGALADGLIALFGK